jgi:hypothetical protein
MIPGSPRSSSDETRRREEVWRAAAVDATATATLRFAQIAQVLDLPLDVVRPFTAAALEVARQYQTECMYANYERRTGHPYPQEGREEETAARSRAWELQLAQLRATLAVHTRVP